ncbi:MAG: hypothetical protein ACRCUY_11740 [Thermoguttaceae bacterium]
MFRKAKAVKHLIDDDSQYTLYKKDGFKDDSARVSHRFVMYDRLTSKN